MEIKYKLEAMSETEYKIDYNFDYSALDPKKLHIQIGHKFKTLTESNQFIATAQATLLYDDGEKVLASNTVMLTFGLSPIKGVITVKDDGTISSQNTLIIDTFLNAAIGTLRGVLMKNLKGTPLEPFFIPLIPIEQFHSNSK